MSDHGEMAAGRLYRVGAHWYLDTALLQAIARRITVEPMQGGYQILAPAGLVRCTPTGLALPGQTGELYRCQGQSPEQDVGKRLRRLAGAQEPDALGGEWEEWPTGALTPTPQKSGCGCTSCKSGGTCPCGDSHTHDQAPQSFLERLIVSETLGTVTPHALTGGGIAIFPAQHEAPEWVCGRYHECIGSILRFPDVAATDWIAAIEVHHGKLAIRWGVVLDRQRTLMLGEILQLVARLADRSERKGSVTPTIPSKHTPGVGAWEMAVELNRRNSLCDRCPYRLGSNLRCPVCRAWQMRQKGPPAAAQPAAIAKVLGEQTELRASPPTALQTIARAIAASNAGNPHEPLTDRFFVQLERDVLVALKPLGLSSGENQAVLEVAELLPFDAQIAVGAAARKEAA